MKSISLCYYYLYEGGSTQIFCVRRRNLVAFVCRYGQRFLRGIYYPGRVEFPTPTDATATPCTVCCLPMATYVVHIQYWSYLSPDLALVSSFPMIEFPQSLSTVHSATQSSGTWASHLHDSQRHDNYCDFSQETTSFFECVDPQSDEEKDSHTCD